MKKDYNLDFKNKNILVVGGNGFLGKEVCEAFHSYSANVIIIDKHISKTQKKKNIDFFKTDISKKNSIDKSFKKIKKNYNNIYSIINCAKFTYKKNIKQYIGKLDNQSYKVFKESLSTNLIGPFYIIKKFSSLMKEKNSNIVNISSIYSLLSPDFKIYRKTKMGNSAAYSASKAAINQLTRWFASQLSPNIRVNSISPGGVIENQNINFIKKYNKKTLLNRMAKKEEVVGPILFLASNLSRYVNGANIIVDGGLSIKI